jgi:hypothetical protein
VAFSHFDGTTLSSHKRGVELLSTHSVESSESIEGINKRQESMGKKDTLKAKID